MRRSNREVTDFNEMLEIMAQCDVCRLALNDDEVPYILPLNFSMHHEDGRVTLFFHGANEGRKYELIARNPNVSFEMDCRHKLLSSRQTAYCTMQYASVIGRGVVEIVPEEEKVAALAALNNRYHKVPFPVNMASVPRTTVMKLTVTSMTAKSNVGKISSPNLVDEADVAEFHRMWDGFPGEAWLTDATSLVVAVNGKAHEAGLAEGMTCEALPAEGVSSFGVSGRAGLTVHFRH